MKIHTTGDTTLKTITATTTVHTASAVPGTGADTTRLGAITARGHTVLGDTAGTTLGTQDGMTLGI